MSLMATLGVSLKEVGGPVEGPLYTTFYKDKRRCGFEKYLESNPQDLVIDFRIRAEDRKVSKSLGDWVAFRTIH